MSKLTVDQARRFAYDAGFRGGSLDIIVAIAGAESGRATDATNTEGNDPADSVDRGILQINSHWHPEVTDECAFDPACAFREGFRISDSGASFDQWATFTGDQYKRFLPKETTPDDWAPEPLPQPEGADTLSSAEYDSLNARVSRLEGLVSNETTTTPAPPSYTVVEGDTASGIAEAHGLDWGTFTALNPGQPQSGNWDMIYPGEVFRVG